LVSWRQLKQENQKMRSQIHWTAGLAVWTALNLALGVLSAADEKTVTITDKDKDTKVQLAKGDKLLVRLEANLTTGYSWDLATNDNDILKSAGKPEYETPKDKKGIVGAGGTQVFTFTAKGAGELDVELQYKRPFDKDTEPAKTFKFKAVVK
jgi:inhibitor of cysteine peptidase